MQLRASCDVSDRHGGMSAVEDFLEWDCEEQDVRTG
jgi:hypothetical protein